MKKKRLQKKFKKKNLKKKSRLRHFINIRQVYIYIYKLQVLKKKTARRNCNKFAHFNRIIF